MIHSVRSAAKIAWFIAPVPVRTSTIASRSSVSCRQQGELNVALKFGDAFFELGILSSAMAAILISRDVVSSPIAVRRNCFRRFRARALLQQIFETRVFAYYLLSAFAIIEQPWVGNLVLKLFEAFAFELDEGI